MPAETTRYETQYTVYPRASAILVLATRRHCPFLYRDSIGSLSSIITEFLIFVAFRCRRCRSAVSWVSHFTTETFKEAALASVSDLIVKFGFLFFRQCRSFISEIFTPVVGRIFPSCAEETALWIVLVFFLCLASTEFRW